MAKKHHAELSASDRESRRRTKNQWMKILEAVFKALAGLFGSLHIKGKDAPADIAQDLPDADEPAEEEFS